MKRKCVYTAIVGSYDDLHQPTVIDPAWDYICFTDSYPPGNLGVWQVRPLPYEAIVLRDTRSNKRASGFVKTHPHTHCSRSTPIRYGSILLWIL